MKNTQTTFCLVKFQKLNSWKVSTKKRLINERKLLRQMNKITLDSIALKMGTKKQYVSKIENYRGSFTDLAILRYVEAVEQLCEGVSQCQLKL